MDIKDSINLREKLWQFANNLSTFSTRLYSSKGVRSIRVLY